MKEDMFLLYGNGAARLPSVKVVQERIGLSCHMRKMLCLIGTQLFLSPGISLASDPQCQDIKKVINKSPQ